MNTDETTQQTETVELNFARAFTLRTDDEREIRFAKGVQQVPAEFADHWYVRENVAPPPVVLEPEPAPVDTSDLEAVAKAAEEALATARAEHAAALSQAEQDKAQAEAKADEAAKTAKEAQEMVQAALADNETKDQTIADLQSQIAALQSAAEDPKKSKG